MTTIPVPGLIRNRGVELYRVECTLIFPIQVCGIAADGNPADKWRDFPDNIHPLRIPYITRRIGHENKAEGVRAVVYGGAGILQVCNPTDFNSCNSFAHPILHDGGHRECRRACTGISLISREPRLCEWLP